MKAYSAVEKLHVLDKPDGAVAPDHSFRLQFRGLLMEDTETKTIASVTVGKKYSTIHRREVSIRHVLEQYFKRRAGRAHWRITYGLSEDGTSTAHEGFTSLRKALATLKQFGPLDDSEKGREEEK